MLKDNGLGELSHTYSFFFLTFDFYVLHLTFNSPQCL